VYRRAVKVAIVGSGIAGLAAARQLAGRHDVTMYEAAPRAGGHVYTVGVDDVAVDMGFIVCNRERYPMFCQLLAELGIALRPTSMSFSVAHDGIEWGSESLSSVFADRRLLVDRRHWRFLAQVVAFLRSARRDLQRGLIDRISLAEYTRDVSRDVRERFVVPLAASLWSLAPALCGAFPAVTYLRFLDQHGMLSPVRPLRWYTVDGGSRRYVDALVARLRAIGRFELRLGAGVTRIDRAGDGVVIDNAHYDRVIVATHADTALRLLAEPSADERRLLGAFRYSNNRTVLHGDRSFLPRRQAAHAAWNYVADPDEGRVAVTYSMTRLQGLPDRPYLVTLNPRREPCDVWHDVTFAHPQFDAAALAAQRELLQLRPPHTYYAGSYFGFGFHEDAMRAGWWAGSRLLADAAREAS